MLRDTPYADFMDHERAVITIMRNLEAGEHCDSGNKLVNGVSTILVHAGGGGNGITVLDRAGLIGGICTCSGTGPRDGTSSSPPRTAAPRSVVPGIPATGWNAIGPAVLRSAQSALSDPEVAETGRGS